MQAEDMTWSGLAPHETATPCLMVLLGATGDLSARKIVPAIYNLARDGNVGEGLVVLGTGRTPWTDEQFREQMLAAVNVHSRSRPADAELWKALSARWHYQQADSCKSDECATIGSRIADLEGRYPTGGNRLFYLATPPSTFGLILEQLAAAGLHRPSREGAFTRVVIEKPFGHDLASARLLNDTALRHFAESQIYRIDHYLGKEVVQNLLILRFANAIFEPMLNRERVDHVQITAAETVGMEGGRGAFYEQAGALRDMVQNHLLQVLAMIAMEPPAALTGEAIRAEKAKLLRALRPLEPLEVDRQTVRGQYAAGNGGRAYRDEKGVAPDSNVETFAALKLFIDNWRWAGVPFYLRTGKRLAQKCSRIVIVFKREPLDLLSPMCEGLREPNRAEIRIFPDEGVSLRFDVKRPGTAMILRPVTMDFRYGSAFEWASPEAYEHLLVDVMNGETTLFIRNDEVEAAWRFVDSIRMRWDQAGQPPLHLYAPLTWGPQQARGLFGDPYVHWHPDEKAE